MNDDLLKDKLKTHDTRLNDHSDRIKQLENGKAATDVKIDNLCEKLAAQTKSINWLIGLMASGLLGFFFYAVQQGIFK